MSRGLPESSAGKSARALVAIRGWPHCAMANSGRTGKNCAESMPPDKKKSSFGFPRRRRLAGRREFGRVFGGRHSAGNRFLVAYAMPNGARESRLGLTVGRRCGNAVQRNRLKRLIREAFRLAFSELPAGFDFVFVPRPNAALSLDEARRSVVSLADRAAKRSTSSTNRD